AECGSSERDEFLAVACAGDPSLRREVESLLRQDAAPVILDRSVWSTAAPLFPDDPAIDRGTMLGPYRIEARLGEGGMGQVFRATDTRLDRPVAIKVLPTGVALDPQMRARFAREARAVAALTHPHICTLYDVGRRDDVDFLVMECLEGDTLAARLATGRLSLDVAMAYARDIASALDHAHAHGIIHRDLKPANIMLTASGAKLLDFGLAKFRVDAPGDRYQSRTSGDITASEARGPSALNQPEGDAPVTRHGTVLGTIRYMAPEQIGGHDVDARSDVFSFGAVAFEMLTGRPAFEGETVAEVRAAVLERDPPAVSWLQPDVPAAIDDVIHRCLAKDVNERFQTAADVSRELQHARDAIDRARIPRSSPANLPSHTWIWIAGLLVAVLAGLLGWAIVGGFQRSSTPGPGEIRSVAVLPLQNLSGDPEQEYFADGMTDQLIADLATIGGLRVIARTSVEQYRAARRPVPTIARELQVDAVIEGAVLRARGRVRLTTKLIAGSSGAILWAQTFERDARDVVALQREIARTITSKVDITLTPLQQARIVAARPLDPEIHREVLLGRHHAARATEEGLRKAVQYFDAAVAKDPADAWAHAGLAEAYTELSGFYVDPREAMPKAKRAAETALRLDENLADAHAALGYVHLVWDWDGPAAEKSLLRALDLNPTLATARLNYAAYLTTQARHDQAVQEIRRALNLDPRSIRTHAQGTVLLLFTRHYDEAIELARKGLEFEPGSGFTLAFQGVAYAEQGRFDEALDNLRRAVQLDDSLTIRALQAHVLAVAGRRVEAQAILRQVQEAAKYRYFCPYEIATVYASLGDNDTAYALFRKGTHEHADCMPWLGVEPWLDQFRRDPRYRTLLRDIGLAPLAH
ncbi:MAG TPA: protein kinase, partial [Vicinamibacterales bacterium]